MNNPQNRFAPEQPRGSLEDDGVAGVIPDPDPDPPPAGMVRLVASLEGDGDQRKLVRRHQRKRSLQEAVDRLRQIAINRRAGRSGGEEIERRAA